jgi:hypothetical protein
MLNCSDDSDEEQSMTTRVTITLPDALAKRVADWAIFAQQDVIDILATAIDVGLPELATKQTAPVEALDDAALLALAEARLDASAGARLDDLLASQREGVLTATERPDLLALMQQYHELWVRQAQALAEAVRRGLRSPLDA